MSSDFTTPLRAFFSRTEDRMIDGVAKEGLLVLRRILDESGFSKSEYLKGVELFAHVIGKDIMFEMLLSADSVEPDGRAAAQDMVEEAMDRAIPDIARTYGLAPEPARIVGMHDARKPVRDARKPARDARKPAGRKTLDRLLGHEIAQHAPRSMRVNRSGKLSISMRRTMREAESGAVHVQPGPLSGIPAAFIEKLKIVLLDKFAPSMAEVVRRSVS